MRPATQDLGQGRERNDLGVGFGGKSIEFVAPAYMAYPAPRGWRTCSQKPSRVFRVWFVVYPPGRLRSGRSRRSGRRDGCRGEPEPRGWRLRSGPASVMWTWPWLTHGLGEPPASSGVPPPIEMSLGAVAGAADCSGVTAAGWRCRRRPTGCGRWSCSCPPSRSRRSTRVGPKRLSTPSDAGKCCPLAGAQRVPDLLGLVDTGGPGHLEVSPLVNYGIDRHLREARRWLIERALLSEAVLEWLPDLPPHYAGLEP